MQCSDNPIEQRGDWSCKLGEGGLQCRSGERNTVDKQREIQLKRTEKYSLDDDQNIVDNVIGLQAVRVRVQFRSGEDESGIYSSERISLIKSKQTTVICFCETMLIKRGGDGLIMHNFTSTIGEICYNTKSDCRFARECQAHQLSAGIYNC